MRVLDLACGAGGQTLMAAQRVSQSGRVVACDISDEILKHTRENADRAGLSNIEIRRSASEDLSGEGEQFDAAYSRLGLMLFASPSTALAALQGVLKPGGRFAALVFSTHDRNPQPGRADENSIAPFRRAAAKARTTWNIRPGGPGVLENLLRYAASPTSKR